LIHLKTSVKLLAELPPFSAADAAHAHSRSALHTLIAIKMTRRRFIARHQEERLPSHAWQFLRPIEVCLSQARASPQQLPLPLFPLPRLLLTPPGSAKPLVKQRAHPAIFSVPLPVLRTTLRAPALTLPDTASPSPQQRLAQIRRLSGHLRCAFRVLPSRRATA